MNEVITQRDYIATVQMLPVCSCGHIFVGGLVYHESIEEAVGAPIKYKNGHFIPMNCPKCNRYIESVEYNGDIITVEKR